MKRMTLDNPRRQRESVDAFIRRFNMMLRHFETAQLYSDNHIARTIAFGQLERLVNEASELLPRLLPQYSEQLLEAVRMFLRRAFRDLDDENEDVIDELEDMVRHLDPRVRRILLNEINRRLTN